MSRPKSKEMDLTVGNPFWSLLKFAIPVILGNLFQLFYTLADSVIVNKSFSLVQSGQYSMTQITEMVGFSNPSRFASAFRKRFGCNPGEYNSVKH